MSDIFSKQIQRIKQKLVQARKVDKNFDVFGADSHRYEIKSRISQLEIDEFEQQFGIELPLCYKTFIREIGNTGTSYADSVPGPFYGIFPLGKRTDEIVETPELCLKKPAIIHPDITDKQWDNMTEILDEDNLSDSDYDEAMNNLYAGIMPLGSQGCTYIHTLVVSGPFSGRVINIDLGMIKPQYCYEANFLDWYERWLDEIISGDLLTKNSPWFGFTMAGNDITLLKTYQNALTVEQKIQALEGLSKLSAIEEQSIETLKTICQNPEKAIAHSAAQLLTKFAYSQSINILSELIEGDDADCLVACQALHWHQRQHAREWKTVLRNRLRKVCQNTTFNFVTYLLEACDYDYGSDITPFLNNENTGIRSQSYYLLGKLNNKHDYLPYLIKGLSDQSDKIVHTTLQALNGIKDKTLLKAYHKVLLRYPKETNYILVNLKHRLKENGFKNRSDFVKRYKPETDTVLSKSQSLLLGIKRFSKQKK